MANIDITYQINFNSGDEVCLDRDDIVELYELLKKIVDKMED